MKFRSVMALACVMAGTMVPSFAEEAHDIDTGRQLFVDDVLVETMDGVVRRVCEIRRGMLPEMIRRCEQETNS